METKTETTILKTKTTSTWRPRPRQLCIKIPNNYIITLHNITLSETLAGPGMAHSQLNKSSMPVSSFKGLAMKFCKITSITHISNYTNSTVTDVPQITVNVLFALSCRKTDSTHAYCHPLNFNPMQFYPQDRQVSNK